MVGPISVRKTKPLPPDLQKFIESAGEDGFIIVSFGSYVEKSIAKEKIDMMAVAFEKLKQKVLWRLKGKITIETEYSSYITHSMLSFLFTESYCKPSSVNSVRCDDIDNNDDVDDDNHDDEDDDDDTFGDDGDDDNDDDDDNLMTMM